MVWVEVMSGCGWPGVRSEDSLWELPFLIIMGSKDGTSVVCILKVLLGEISSWPCKILFCFCFPRQDFSSHGCPELQFVYQTAFKLTEILLPCLLSAIINGMHHHYTVACLAFFFFNENLKIKKKFSVHIFGWVYGVCLCAG